jgi:hypothetical protein
VSRILSLDELVADSIEIRWRIEGEFFSFTMTSSDSIHVVKTMESGWATAGFIGPRASESPLGCHIGRALERLGRLGSAVSAGPRERWKNGMGKLEAGRAGLSFLLGFDPLPNRN